MLQLNHITKKYPGVTALDDVSIRFEKGEVHAIAGENGAGKSTLIKILAGAIRQNSGTIVFNDHVMASTSPNEAIALGISTIYQEFNLIPYLSIAENMFYGREPQRFGFIDRQSMNKMASDLCSEMGVTLDPKLQVKKLGVAYQQIVEILKAVSLDTKLLIMDEPTAPLTTNEIQVLFKIVEKVRLKSVTVIYISHRLDEIFSICDRVSVLRDGKLVSTRRVSETNEQALISDMVGRELKDVYPLRTASLGEERLCVDGFASSKLNNVSLRLRRGEILGIGGLVGAGRTELARAIFGADPLLRGQLSKDGTVIKVKSPQDAIKNGIALIPEDRKQHGILLGMSIKDNISFPILQKFAKLFFLNKSGEHKFCTGLASELRIKAPSIEQLVKNLSGGNQQKVVLAKWLATRSEIFIFDEPTRGIDVGAKQEIYHLLNELSLTGKSIIMISSEMPELMGMADRILVMRDGAIQGQIEREEFSQEKIFKLASGNRGLQ